MRVCNGSKYDAAKLLAYIVQQFVVVGLCRSLMLINMSAQKNVASHQLLSFATCFASAKTWMGQNKSTC